MGLLDNASVRKSREIFREYKPGSFGARMVEPMTIETTDVPCVEVQIPQRDWDKIVEIIQAYERTIKNPAVQDAWDQYLMIKHLTDQNLPKR